MIAAKPGDFKLAQHRILDLGCLCRLSWFVLAIVFTSTTTSPANQPPHMYDVYVNLHAFQQLQMSEYWMIMLQPASLHSSVPKSDPQLATTGVGLRHALRMAAADRTVPEGKTNFVLSSLN